MLDLFSIGIMLFASFIGAFATTLIKKSINKYPWKKLFASLSFWGCAFIFGLSVLMYIYLLQTAELSVLYPLVSTSYIWTTLFSIKLLGEKMNFWKWAALTGIMLGVVLIGLGS